MERDTHDLMEMLAAGPLVVPSVMNASKARGIVGMILALKGRLSKVMIDMEDVFEGRYVQSSPELVGLAKKAMDAYAPFRAALMEFETRAQEMAKDRPS